MKNWFILFLLTAISLLSAAQTGKKTPTPGWTKEPELFMGIRIGATLDQQPNLVACPMIESGNSPYALAMVDTKFEGLCYEPPGTGVRMTWTLHNTPQLSVPFYAKLEIDKATNSIKSVRLSLLRSRFNEFQKILLERYGPPSVTEKREFVNRFGATFIGRDSNWNGRKISMALMEIFNEVDDSALIVYSEAFIAKQSQELDQKTKSSAGKL